MEEIKNKGGRPKENTHVLLQRELSATLKTFGQVRNLIEDQIAEIRKLINATDVSIGTRLEVAKHLVEIAASLATNIEKMGKFHMDKRVRSAEESESNVEVKKGNLLKELLKK